MLDKTEDGKCAFLLSLVPPLMLFGFGTLMWDVMRFMGGGGISLCVELFEVWDFFGSDSLHAFEHFVNKRFGDGSFHTYISPWLHFSMGATAAFWGLVFYGHRPASGSQ